MRPLLNFTAKFCFKFNLHIQTTYWFKRATSRILKRIIIFAAWSEISAYLEWLNIDDKSKFGSSLYCVYYKIGLWSFINDVYWKIGFSGVKGVPMAQLYSRVYTTLEYTPLGYPSMNTLHSWVYRATGPRPTVPLNA